MTPWEYFLQRDICSATPARREVRWGIDWDAEKKIRSFSYHSHFEAYGRGTNLRLVCVCHVKTSLRKHPFLLALGHWGRFVPPRETSAAVKSEEKRMFSQAKSKHDKRRGWLRLRPEHLCTKSKFYSYFNFYAFYYLKQKYLIRGCLSSLKYDDFRLSQLGYYLISLSVSPVQDSKTSFQKALIKPNSLSKSLWSNCKLTSFF